MSAGIQFHIPDYQTLSIINHYSFFCTLNNEYVPSKTLYVDKNGYVWVGTQRGLYIMNPETEEYSHFTNSKSDIFTLPSNSVWTIEEDAQKNVWIGTEHIRYSAYKKSCSG